MANQITDNRISRAVAQTSAPASETWEASGGGGSVIEDTTTFIEGTTSVTEQISDSRRVMLYDNGSTIDISNSHVYIWVNCGVVGRLESKANGGMTVRLTGPTSTNFVEWYVGGNDSWPASIAGGWTMFVVDTASTPSNTGGTPPALTAIQKIGISAITTAMTKAADNTWVDAIWTLADGNPGIIVEGRNAGTTDWTFADINTQLGDSAGMFVQSDGGAWKCNAPIQFGINDTTTHGFTDTNATLLWDDQEFVASDHYGMTALGNSGGTTRVILGAKSGTGTAATGAQGGNILAAATGARYFMDFDDPNLDDIGFYGVNFQHGGDFQLDDAATSAISCLFIDCSSANITDCRDFLKNKIIDANTADGVAFITTNDLADMVLNEFEFSDGHAVELTTTPSKVTSQTDDGNKYSGYGATGTNDAEYYNNTGAGLVTISVNSPGNGADYRNGTSATTTVQNTVTLTVTVKDSNGNAVEGARVRIEDDPLGTLISNGSTNASGVYSDGTYNYAGDEDVKIIVRLKGYVFFSTLGTIISTGISVPVTLVTDTVVELP